MLVEELGIKQPNLIFQIMKYEFKRNINKYLSTTNPEVQVKSLKDIVQYNKDHDDVALKEMNTKHLKETFLLLRKVMYPIWM